MLQRLIIALCLSSVAPVCIANDNHLLDGTWSSKCAKGDDANFLIETFQFSGNVATYSVNTFSDSACQKPISSLTTHRTFKLGEPVANLSNTRKLDYVFNSVTMTYKDPTIIAIANQSPGYYGLTNWVIDKPKDVTNLKKTSSANKEHAKGEKFFTIVKIQPNALFMGDYASGTGSSDATRLSAIYQVPFIKAAK